MHSIYALGNANSFGTLKEAGRLNYVRVIHFLLFFVAFFLKMSEQVDYVWGQLMNFNLFFLDVVLINKIFIY